MNKTALITGNGQDTNYLAKFLLNKDYNVIIGTRRSGSSNNWRAIELGIDKRVNYVTLDLTEYENVRRVISEYKPDEIYNLAAQSFVQDSFAIPVSTSVVNYLGVLYILEAVRTLNFKETKIYQASTSEMFGEVQEVPQNELTPFYPKSPYGIAKLGAHWLIVNYRETYKMFACSGILFNHECITEDTPIILLRDGLLEILPAGDDIVPHPTNFKHDKSRTTLLNDRNWYIWDKNQWSKITCMTANYKEEEIYQINSRSSVFQVTQNHQIFVEENKKIFNKKSQEIQLGEKLALSSLPKLQNKIEVNLNFAWFLGLLIAEGTISRCNIRISNTDLNLLNKAKAIWELMTGGYCNIREYKPEDKKTGFKANKILYQMDFSGIIKEYREYLKKIIYTKKGFKKVPYLILNSTKEIQLSFLKGYYAGDGLKQENSNITYEFSCLGTNSSSLALGLYWICYNVLDQRMTLYTEEKNNKIYYKINLTTPKKISPGNHLKKDKSEVTKIIKKPYKGWVFDFATDSGSFSAGVGLGWIHNSPLRGEEFVTRKITKSVAEIWHNQREFFEIGNPEALRDWGFAGDYVEAMWLMLQQTTPQDFVISTGETHSVKEFIEEAFHCINETITWEGEGVDLIGKNSKDVIRVKINPKYYRPCEVDILLGDSLKAQDILKWYPKTTFKELIQAMVTSDIHRLSK